MKKLIKKVIMWAFDNKVTYQDTKVKQRDEEISITSRHLNLDGYVSRQEFDDRGTAVNLLVGELSELAVKVRELQAGMVKENTVGQDDVDIKTDSLKFEKLPNGLLGIKR